MATYKYLEKDGSKVQVESAKRDGDGKNIANNYAKQNGYYATLGAGSADTIASNREIENPEESCPPITMGITGNEAEIKTGIEKFEYLEGKSKVWNQISYYDLKTSTAFLPALPNDYFSSTYTQNDNGITLTCVSFTGRYNLGVYLVQNADQTYYKIIAGHKYYLTAYAKSSIGDVFKVQHLLDNKSGGVVNIKTDWTHISGFITPTNSNKSAYLYFGNIADVTAGQTLTIKNWMIFDLTLMGLDSITSVDEFKALYPNDYYAYNAGSILSTKPYQLISRGRQQWDEEWEVGNINNNTGADSSTSGYIRSKNYCRCMPNKEYFGYTPNVLIRVFFYDENYSYISNVVVPILSDSGTKIFTTPSNAYYFRLKQYNTAYNNDITISIYFDDGEGYDEYYAYRQDVVDLPNIELRAIGDLKDIVYASGGGTRKLGYVDLSTISFTYSSGSNCWIGVLATAKVVDNNTPINAIHSLGYTMVKASGYTSSHSTKTIAMNTSTQIFVDNGSTTTEPSGYLLYELTTPTTIPTSENAGWEENVYVDNYGTLQFVTNPQQIPQVKQPYFIRYTVDLVEFLDGTYVRASGDPDNLALVSELEEQREQLENGQLVPSKSLTANEINPVSSESGDTQETPFALQGTGTANGTSSVDTGTVGKHIQKQGSVYCVNQQVENGNFASSSGWLATNSGTLSVVNNIGTLTGTQSGYTNLNRSATLYVNHTYLFICSVKSSVNISYNFGMTWQGLGISSKSLVANTWTTFSQIVLMNTGGNVSHNMSIGCSLGEGNTLDLKNVQIIDLTQWFNGNIPQDLLDHPEHWSWYQTYGDYITYNTGTLVSGNGKYLVCGGRNVFDEQIEGGTLTDGQPATAQNTFRSKNYTQVISGMKYILKTAYDSTYIQYLLEYDENHNYITQTNLASGDHTKTLTDKTKYVKITIGKSGTGWGTNPPTKEQAQITISLYYTGEDYSQYYPYEQPKVYDTGTETLLSTGVKLSVSGEREDVYDYKEPSGLITRRVGIVDLGTLNWTVNSAENGRFLAGYSINQDIIGLIFRPADLNTVSNGLCSKYQIKTWNDISANSVGIAIYGGSGGGIFICDTSLANKTAEQFKTAMSGVYLIYELATPTTEQGTPFSENIEINDFGTMGWYATYTDSNTNTLVSVPQGCKIFYPAWCVGFVDTLGQREDIDWDANNVVSQSELGVVDTKHDNLYAILQENIGGALRHQLASANSLDFNNTTWVDLGTLTWTYNNGRYITESLANLIKRPTGGSVPVNALCPLYKTVEADGSSIDKNLCVSTATGGLFVRDSTYTGYANATTFKIAMKGILLAYEKA